MPHCCLHLICSRTLEKKDTDQGIFFFLAFRLLARSLQLRDWMGDSALSVLIRNSDSCSVDTWYRNTPLLWITHTFRLCKSFLFGDCIIRNNVTSVLEPWACGPFFSHWVIELGMVIVQTPIIFLQSNLKNNKALGYSEERTNFFYKMLWMSLILYQATLTKCYWMWSPLSLYLVSEYSLEQGQAAGVHV